MTTHAKLSPSARYRWGTCPASVRVMEFYPKDGKSSPSALDGTRSHSLLEHCIKDAEGCAAADPSTYLGLMFTDKDGRFGIDQQRIERVRVATDYINRRVLELTQAGMVVEVIAEKRVHPDALLGRNDLSGTVDVQLVTDTMVELIDYKDGMNPVSAENNTQLEQYAVGVLSENIAAGFKRPLETVIMTIIQPKAALKGGESITSSTVAVSEFYTTIAPKIAEEAAATDDPDAPFVPGDKQCTYCPHAGNCHSLSTWSLNKAGIKFDDMTVVREAADKSPDTMTDAQLRELIEAGPILRKVIEEAEAEALRRITSGKPVEGLKVVRGHGRRSWALPEEQVAEKLKKMGVPKEVLWKTTLISAPTVIDTKGASKLQWVKRDGTTKELTTRQVDVIKNELITKSSGSLLVVSENDGRDAVEYMDLSTTFAPVVEVPAVEVPALPTWLS